MTVPLPDLQEIVGATEIVSADRFFVAGSRFEVPSDAGDNGGLTSLLTSALYRCMYCRPTERDLGRPPDRRAVRVFVDELSRANTGDGTWDPGWRVESVDSEGTLVVVNEHGGLTVWAQPEEFRGQHDSVVVGSVGRIRVGKEWREMLPGYYTALGNADQPEADADVVRIYWHLTADLAVPWMRGLTHRLNEVRIPFRAKVLSDPAAYFRADAGVLYLPQRDFDRAVPPLQELHRAVAGRLRATIPMFTRRLARGLAVAEDPGDGRSFGQHRCELVAAGLVSAFTRGCEASERAAAVTSFFAQEGLDISRPWLSPGSQRRYGWPRQAERR